MRQVGLLVEVGSLGSVEVARRRDGLDEFFVIVGAPAQPAHFGLAASRYYRPVSSMPSRNITSELHKQNGGS